MQTTVALPARPTRFTPTAPLMLAAGFAYWLIFLLALEPDNIMRAVHAGMMLSWSLETMRILVASLIGCAATPVLVAQVRWFPVEGGHWRRNGALQLAGTAATTFGLIFVSCVLAAILLPKTQSPFGTELTEQLIANGPVVGFCVGAFVVLAHAVRFFEQTRVRPLATATTYLATIPVRDRGRVTLVDVADIDWLEAQGNYVALHTGAQTHLIRDSLARLEARLDPARFVRVHRQSMVAMEQIETVASLGAGDSELLLKGGAKLRLSRTYRDRLDALLQGRER
jgi:two-component system LytT family response regulator